MKTRTNSHKDDQKLREVEKKAIFALSAEAGTLCNKMGLERPSKEIAMATVIGNIISNKYVSR